MGSPAATQAHAQEALQAGRRARVVRRARLAPAQAEDGAQMRFTLEDALRTVDFGDCGRLVVVRRLRLQGLPPGAGTTLVARALQDAWRALAPRAVAPEHPQAEHADAVYFASIFEARLAWLAALAGGPDPTAWYWRAAIPELAPGAAKADTSRSIDTLVEALLQESVDATLKALRGWKDDALIALAHCLPQAASERLLQAATRCAAVPVRPQAVVEVAGAIASRRPVATAWLGVVQRLSRVAAQSPPPPWLAALWISVDLGKSPTRDQVELLMSLVVPGPAGDAASFRAQGGPAASVSEATPGSRNESNVAFASSAVADDLSPDAASAHTTASPPASAVDARHHVRMASDLPAASPPRSQPAPRRHANELPWLDDFLPTAQGGLLLLVNLLQALRFESWLATQPGATRQRFVHALFAHILHTGHCAPEEPQLGWFAEQPAAERAPAPTPPSTPTRRWTLRIRRALRQRVGIDLDALVRRRAWVCATPTHIDIIFPLEQTDLRLRRVGLDSDPGWVPWFGRIVAFHFLARNLLPQYDDALESASHG